MKRVKFISSEEGYTIQELLVVLIVSSLLFSFGMSIYMSASKTVGGWTKKNELRESVQRTLSVVSSDLMRCSELNDLTDSALSIVRENKFVVYHFDGKNVCRNDVQLSKPENVDIGMNIVREGDNSDSTKMLLTITIFGNMKSQAYEATVTVNVPMSSKQLFTASNKEIN
jgi:type II secretory pathway pseudopilin PulG